MADPVLVEIDPKQLPATFQVPISQVLTAGAADWVCPPLPPGGGSRCRTLCRPAGARGKEGDRDPGLTPGATRRRA